MSIGDNIRSARIAKKMSQKELAEAISTKEESFGHTSISNWENNINKPDPDTIGLLCEALDVDANFLLGFSSPEEIFKGLDELDKLLFSKTKALTDDEKKAVLQVMDAIHKDIDKELDNK